jgi:hypothetical protein
MGALGAAKNPAARFRWQGFLPPGFTGDPRGSKNSWGVFAEWAAEPAPAQPPDESFSCETEKSGRPPDFGEL